MNQFVGNKMSRDLCLKCDCKPRVDSLAGQNGYSQCWKFHVQEKCLTILTAARQAIAKILGQSDLRNILRFQGTKITLTLYFTKF